MRLIDADRLLEVYDQIHIGPPGNARIMIVTAPTVEIPGWVSVKDRLPEIRHRVLFTGLNTNGFWFTQTQCGCRLEDGWYSDIHQRVMPPSATVTHWMPLPEPPGEVSGDGQRPD